MKPALPDIERRTVALTDAECRMSGDTLTIEGHAAVFGEWSEDLGFRERIQRGAFRKTLRSNPDVRFLINHEGLPLARSTVKEGEGSLRLSEDTTGLHFSADLVPTTQARDLGMLVDRDVVNQMSFGFSMRDGGVDEWNTDYTERDIVQFGGLFDVSAVTFPAYTQTDASMRALVAGFELIGEDGAVHEDLLDVLAQRIHRDSIRVSAEERGRVDAVFAQLGRLSPWTEELARRALDLEPAATAPSTQVEGADDNPATAVGPWRRTARARRLVLSELNAT